MDLPDGRAESLSRGAASSRRHARVDAMGGNYSGTTSLAELYGNHGPIMLACIEREKSVATLLSRGANGSRCCCFGDLAA